MLKIGLSHTSHLTVTPAETAVVIGSGDMDVLATPSMLALMENAAMLAVAPHLPEGSTTVGGHIESSHLHPTAVGMTISATATLEKVDGRKLHFTVNAFQGDTMIGSGTHLRFIVDRAKFLDNLQR